MVGLALGAMAVLFGWQRWGRAPATLAGAAKGDSVLLVTLDTTRADHLGSYGHARAHTPTLDRLAAEGVRFDRAFSPAPLTLPAHSSILTGLEPFQHGVRNNGNFYLDARFPTLATVLRQGGYTTAAFVSAFVLDSRYGLTRGFERYDDRMDGGSTETVDFEAERRGDRTEAAFRRWLEELPAAPGAPFFAWLHLYDAHEPYAPPSPFKEDFADAPYDGEIAFDDSVLASALEALRARGRLDRTVVAVIGDHGESLGEHGEEAHSMFVYDGAVRVPLVLWRPGLLPAGRVVQSPVRAVDLAPTLLALVGASPLPSAAGRSLLGLAQGEEDPHPPPVYAETLLPQLDMGWAPLRSIRDGRYKLIEAPRPELYDLQRDPGEASNLYAAQPSTASALRQALEALTGGGWGEKTAQAVDREAREKLAALGYVGGGEGEAERPSGGAEKDPKDMVAVFTHLRHANVLSRARRFEEALAEVQEARALDPDNAFASYLEGSARMGLGQYVQAAEALRRYVRAKPAKAHGHHLLALCELWMNRREDALREANAALAIEPKLSDTHLLKGRLLQEKGDLAGALAEYLAAVQASPANPVLRLALARGLVEARRLPEAREQFQAVLQLQPDYGPALAGLGMVLGREGDMQGAVRTLQRAVAADPSADQARFALAQALEQTGRTEEARAEFQALTEGLRAALAAHPERSEQRLNLARVLERQGRRAEARVEYARLAADPAAPPLARSLARERLARP